MKLNTFLLPRIDNFWKINFCTQWHSASCALSPSEKRTGDHDGLTVGHQALQCIMISWTTKLWKFISVFFVFVVFVKMLLTLVPAANMQGCGYRSMEVGCRVEISTNQLGKRTQELMHSPIKLISNHDTTEHLRKGVMLWFWHVPAEGPWTATDTSIPGIWILPADDEAARSLAAQALNFSQHTLLSGQGRQKGRASTTSKPWLPWRKDVSSVYLIVKTLNCQWWYRIFARKPL